MQLPKYKIMELSLFAEMMSKANLSITWHPTFGHKKLFMGESPMGRITASDWHVKKILTY